MLNVFEWSRGICKECEERMVLNLLEKWMLFMLGPEISSVCPKEILVCSNTQKYERCRYGVGTEWAILN